MSKLWMGGTIVSLFAIFAAFVYWKGGARDPRPARPGSNEELAAMRAELDALKRNSATSLLLARTAGEREPQLGAAASAAPATSPVPEAPKRRSQQEEDEEARRLELARAESLDRQFEAEPVDRSWAPLASQEARRALQTEVDGSTSVNHVDCRSTWCRIETVHHDVEAFKAFANKSLLSRERQLWNGGVSATIRDDSDGSVTAVTFITREGHAMPLPEGEESTTVDLHAAAAR